MQDHIQFPLKGEFTTGKEGKFQAPVQWLPFSVLPSSCLSPFTMCSNDIKAGLFQKPSHV